MSAFKQSNPLPQSLSPIPILCRKVHRSLLLGLTALCNTMTVQAGHVLVNIVCIFPELGVNYLTIPPW